MGTKVYNLQIFSENVIVTSGVRRTKVEYSIIKRYREYAVVIKPTLTLWRDTCPPPDRGACVSASSDVGHGIVGGEIHFDDVGLDHGAPRCMYGMFCVFFPSSVTSSCSFLTHPCSFLTHPALTRGYFYIHLSALEVLTIE